MSPNVPDDRGGSRPRVEEGCMRQIGSLLTGSVMIIALGLALAMPATAPAQGTKAGVVTTLQGEAKVERVTTTQPGPQVLPLKFKDDVFMRDIVRTGDQSLARILLGGKAVVTVREHSSLTITETADTSTIEITAGRIALAVAKEKMKPTERIDVKTPNAVAGVRGTVLITEVTLVGALYTSTFTLLNGLVDVTLLDPAGARLANPFVLNALQTLGITGFTRPGGPRNITAAEAQRIANSYKARLHQPPAVANQQVSDRQVEQAVNSAGAGGGGVSDPFRSFVTSSGATTPRVSQNDIQTSRGETANALTPAPAPVPAPPPTTCTGFCCTNFCEGAARVRAIAPHR
jgi:hypothetical protein